MKKRYDAYANYYYKYNKKGKFKTKLLIILFCLFTIMVVVFFSISFSNFLTISKIVNVNSNYIYENRTLYALSLYSSNNKTEVNTYSDNIKKQGGAGYVYKNNDIYYVLSSIYKSSGEANKVKNNLQENGVNSEIIKIEIPAINFKATLTTNSSKILSEGVGLFYNNYSDLYNLSVEFDKQNIDTIKAKSKINDMHNQNLKIVKNFSNYFNQSTNVYILYVKIYLNKLNSVINDLLNLDDSENLSSSIKETYCNIIGEYLNLYKEML